MEKENASLKEENKILSDKIAELEKKEDILYELDLDFDLVTMGANCYSGVQRNEFNTKKYGILHTEFRYCKSNRTMVFRVYNDTKDQKLREPKPGELAQFDENGKK